MGWFSWGKKEKVQETPSKEDLWTQCASCKAMLFKEEWHKSFKVCTVCGFHDKLTAQERVDLLVDPKSFSEFDRKVSFSDPLKFSDDKGTYAEKAKQACDKTGLKEAVLTGRGKLGGNKIVLAIMDFNFLGGSLGSGTGEKIFRAAEYARKHRIPLIIASASGGARMHEGILSLMQMAKTSGALARHAEARLPYISVLTHPTTGGVTASFATLGDIIIAEPKCMIGFAGPRVVKETTHADLPPGFQTAEFMLQHGLVDQIVARKDMRPTLGKLLRYTTNAPV
jgi:acetyl-CoA carboxylase carboxyl transferase subunit beta